MRFAQMSTLIFLIGPLLGAFMLLTGIVLRKKLLARLGTGATVEAQFKRPSPYLRAIKGISLILGLFALVVATARPQYGGRVTLVKNKGIDIVVALDFSKSMLAQDVSPDRISRAKLELADFISQLQGDRIGLVAFAGDTIRFPLTTDYTAAQAFWRNMGPYDMPVGGTAIGRALNAGLEMLFDSRGLDEVSGLLSSRSKVIILLTDGEDHEGAPLEVAEKAAQKGVRIFTVGIGSNSPELIPRYLDDGTPMGYQRDRNGEYVTTALTGENEDVLRTIAAKTGGRYTKAGKDLSGLSAIVDEIRNMKQSELESGKTTIYEEIFHWFLVPGFVFLLLAWLLPSRKKEES